MFKREALDVMSVSELSEIASALGFKAGKQGKEELINSILKEQEQFMTNNAEPEKEEAAAPKVKRGKKPTKEAPQAVAEPEIILEIKEDVLQDTEVEKPVESEINKPEKRTQSPLNMEPKQEKGNRGRIKKPIDKTDKAKQITFFEEPIIDTNTDDTSWNSDQVIATEAVLENTETVKESIETPENKTEGNTETLAERPNNFRERNQQNQQNQQNKVP